MSTANRAEILDKIKSARGNLILLAGFMLGLSCREDKSDIILKISFSGGSLIDVGIEFIHALSDEDLKSLVCDLNNELNNREHATRNTF